MFVNGAAVHGPTNNNRALHVFLRNMALRVVLLYQSRLDLVYFVCWHKMNATTTPASASQPAAVAASFASDAAYIVNLRTATLIYFTT
ncbi:hypothetical protein RRF57_008674 [Xylaria bambusicola]|uniref:Uncharacterized protein n=1 Tax=Xylaria bambusicola TaxID=326684 RepID=A0AAN7Z0X0_9PEZI